MFTLFVILIGIFIHIKNMKAKGKNITLSDIFIKNVKTKFEIMATISTGSEVVSLILQAIDRGIEPFSAVVRFVGMGFFELMFTFLFLSISISWIQGVINYSFRDNKMHWWEWSYLVPVYAALLLLLPIFTWPTWMISKLYFESIGLMKLDYSSVNWLFGVTISTTDPTTINPETGEIIKIHPELGALIFIWMTPALNIMQAILAPVEMIQKARVKAAKNIKEEKEQKNKDKKDKKEKTNQEITIDEAIDRLQATFKWNSGTIKDNLKKILGRDNSDKSMVNTAIASGKATDKELEENIRKIIIGEEAPNHKGLFGYLDLSNVSAEFKDEIEKMGRDLTKKRDELNSGTWEDPDDSIKDGELKAKKQALDNEVKELSEKRETTRIQHKKVLDKMKNVKDQLETKLKKMKLL
jgi:hypothetical protein